MRDYNAQIEIIFFPCTMILIMNEISIEQQFIHFGHCNGLPTYPQGDSADHDR